MLRTVLARQVADGALKASVEASHTLLHQLVETSVEAMKQDLVQLVATSNDHFKERVRAIARSSEGPQKLHLEDQLRISKDGKSAGAYTLNDRMENLRKIVTAEKKRIDNLGRQWVNIHQSITGLALEVVGPEGLGDLLCHVRGELPGYAVPTDKSFEEEVQRDEKRLRDEITKANDSFIVQAETCDQV